MGLSQENAHFLKENSTICRSFCKETMGHRFAISVLIYGRLYPTYVPIKSQLYLYPTCIRIIVFSYLYNSLYIYIYIYLQYIQYIPIISPSFHPLPRLARTHREGATNAPWDCQVDAPRRDDFSEKPG